MHAAAPCPVQVKEQMIDWWGPIIREYYGATEGLGFAYCDSEEWLAHKGTVGRIIAGTLHVLDEAGNPLPKARLVNSGSSARQSSPTSTTRRKPLRAPRRTAA